MKTNTILKAFSVALLLSSVLPAFGMNYFRRMTQTVRPTLTMRPALTLRSQIAARMARSFVPRAQVAVTLPKMAVRPAVMQTCTPTVSSSSSWYSWFKKPFVAVASFLGLGVATTSQPALAQADDESVEELAQKTLKKVLKDKTIKTVIENADEQQWQTALPLVDTYVFDKCFIDQDEGRQCAQLRERTLSLLQAERMKRLQAVSDKEREANVKLAELRAQRLQQLTENERREVETTSAEIWKSLSAGFKDSQNNRVSISTVPDDILAKAIEIAAVNKCLEPNSKVCAEAKKRAAKAIADFRKAVVAPRASQQSVPATTQEPKNDSV